MMVVIRSLKLSNFRGIQQGSLELAPLTILIGPNNAGKTTILESLFLLPNPFREVPFGKHGNKALDVVHSLHTALDSKGYAFLFHRYRIGTAQILCETDEGNCAMSFRGREGDSMIYVCYDELPGNRHLQLPTDTIDGRTQTGLIGDFSAKDGGGRYRVSEPLIGDILMLSPSLVEMGYEYVRGRWESIANAGILRPIAEEVSKYSNDQYLDFTIEPYQGEPGTVYLYLRDGRRIRINDVGRGIQNYAVARILYEHRQPEVLLWEDYEAHFNPLLLLGIAEWISDIVDKGKQIILSTHSLEALTIIAQTCKKAKIVFVTLENGILKAKDFALDEAIKLMEGGIDIRMAKSLIF
jgi:predicted ATPase